MSLQDRIISCIERFGVSALIDSNGEKNISALITPLDIKDKRFAAGEFSKAGLTDTNYYLYISSPENAPEYFSTPLIKAMGKTFRAAHWKNIFFADKAIYCCAVIYETDEGGEDA